MPDAGGYAAATGGSINAIAFGVAADLVYNVFSATNSSPQTTELFASARANTLWKYVKLGGLQSAVLIGIMAAQPGATAPVIAGGALAGLFMFMMYRHALAAGQTSSEAAPV